MPRKFPRVYMETSKTFSCGHNRGRPQLCSWQWTMRQQFLMSIDCHFESLTDFLINIYCQALRQVLWTQGDFCKCGCLVLSAKPGEVSPVFYTVAPLWGLKAERGAVTRNYREMWVNLTQEKTVLWLQMFNNGVTWLWKQWVFRKSWNCSKSGYVILEPVKIIYVLWRINLDDFWVPFQLFFFKNNCNSSFQISTFKGE